MIPCNPNKECAFCVYVEGVEPSEPGSHETITVQYCQAGQVIATDAVTVAEPMFAIFGYGSTEESKTSLRNYLDSVNGDDPRTDPYVFTKDGHAFSVYIWDTQKGMKIALQTQDSYVAYEGHTLISFGDPGDVKSITDFMNVGEPLMDIGLYQMRKPTAAGGLGYTGLTVGTAQYGGPDGSHDVWRYGGDEVNYTTYVGGEIRGSHFSAHTLSRPR